MNMHDVKVGETYWCNDGWKRKVVDIYTQTNELGFEYERVDFVKISLGSESPGTLSKRSFAKRVTAKVVV